VVFGEHSNITTLGEAAFQQCDALTSITLPDKLKVIGEKVFSRCTSSERVVCNKHLKTIGIAEFQNCYALTSITLPDKLEVIEETAFAECTSLKHIVCNKNLKTIGGTAFGDAPSSKMPSLHPAPFPSVMVHSLRVIA